MPLTVFLRWRLERRLEVRAKVCNGFRKSKNISRLYSRDLGRVALSIDFDLELFSFSHFISPESNYFGARIRGRF